MSIFESRDPEWTEEGRSERRMESDLDISRLVRGILRRRVMILVAALVIGVTLAIPVLLLQRSQYLAEAKLLVRDARVLFSGTPLASSAGLNAGIDTSAAMVTTEPVLEAAARQLSFEDRDRLAKKLTVTSSDRSRVVTIGARDGDPEQAALVANTISRIFLDLQGKRLQAQIDEAVAQLRDRVNGARERLESTQDSIGDFVRNHGLGDDEELLKLVEQTAEVEERIAVSRSQIDGREQQLAVIRDRLDSSERFISSSTTSGSQQFDQSGGLRSDGRKELDPLVAAWTRSKQQQSSGRMTSRSVNPNPVHQSLFLAAVEHETALVALRSELGSLEERLVVLREKLGMLPDLRRELNGLRVERDFAKQELSASLQSVAAVENLRHLDNPIYEVLEQAEPPENPEQSRNSLALVGVFLVGLAGGVGMAFALEVRDTRIREAREIERLGATVLATVPNREAAPQGYAEAVRQVALSLRRTLSEGGEGKCIVFVSARTGEGKSDMLCGSARVLSEWGESVLRIDANLREKTDQPGRLERFLAGEAERPAVAKFDSGVCAVTTAGGRSDAPDLLARGRWGDLLRFARKDFRYVLIDTPAVLPSVDAEMIAEKADGIVLVVRAFNTPKKDVATAIAKLQSTGTPLIGAVLTDAETAPEKPEVAG